MSSKEALNIFGINFAKKKLLKRRLKSEVRELEEKKDNLTHSFQCIFAKIYEWKWKNRIRKVRGDGKDRKHRRLDETGERTGELLGEKKRRLTRSFVLSVIDIYWEEKNSKIAQFVFLNSKKSTICTVTKIEVSNSLKGKKKMKLSAKKILKKKENFEFLMIMRKILQIIVIINAKYFLFLPYNFMKSKYVDND